MRIDYLQHACRNYFGNLSSLTGRSMPESATTRRPNSQPAASPNRNSIPTPQHSQPATYSPTQQVPAAGAAAPTPSPTHALQASAVQRAAPAAPALPSIAIDATQALPANS
ncbi:MAG: hypothetical protein R3C56_09750 [Pirellulaceae bacterium]